MMDDTDIDSFTIDPPPHDRSYFQDQIIAVSNYFFAASKGYITVTGQVYPSNNGSSYLLNRQMGYYNPNTTESENNRRLAQLFIEAISYADTNDNDLNFADFNPDSNLIVIFHAGVGKDVDLGYDSTPQDIPSLYMLNDPQNTYYQND